MNKNPIFDISELIESLNSLSVDAEFATYNTWATSENPSYFGTLQAFRRPSVTLNTDVFLIASDSKGLQKRVGQKVGEIYQEFGEIGAPESSPEEYESFSFQMDIPLEFKRMLAGKTRTILAHQTRFIATNLDGYAPNILRKDNSRPLAHKGVMISRQSGADEHIPSHVFLKTGYKSNHVKPVAIRAGNDSFTQRTLWDAYKGLALRLI